MVYLVLTIIIAVITIALMPLYVKAINSTKNKRKEIEKRFLHLDKEIEDYIINNHEINHYKQIYDNTIGEVRDLENEINLLMGITNKENEK